jgi:hypothetical protein
MAALAAVFIFILGVGLLTLGFNRRLHSIRSNQQLTARCAADYGLTEALYKMNLRDWTDATLPAESSISIPGCDATYSYTVTNIGGTYSVRSSGKSGAITKTVICDLRLKSAFEYAILTKNTLDIGSCSKVECVGCGNNPLKIGTTNNPNEDAEIILKPNSVVDGDILLGQGGIPSLVVGPGATYHNIYAVATDYDLPMPTVPADINSGPLKAALNNPASVTSGKYPSLTLGAHKKLDINGVVDLYITGDIHLGTDANIVLAPNAKLTIYLAGSFNGNNGAGFNNSGDPNKLAIYGLGSGAINIKNSYEFHGTIYAPDAYVYIYNGVKVYGSVIAKDYKQDNSAIFTYDAKLRKITDASLTRFVPSHWREQ